MVTADRLVEQLRGRAAPASRCTGRRRRACAGGPAARCPPTRRPRPSGPPGTPRRLPSASVPVVLLPSVALCLLVAAIVFVAVTWSLLGLTGRTLVLLGFTGLLAAVAVVLTRKGLRGAAETFWLVVAGMLTVDLLAAESAGLAGLDALDWRGTGALVGGALLALGVGVGAWARSQPVGRLYGAEVVAVIGGAGALLCATPGAAENPAIGTTVADPAAGRPVRAAAPRWCRWRRTRLGGLAGPPGWCLLGLGWDRALETARLGDWWADFRGWPLLVAAVLAAVVVHLPACPNALRPFAAGAALLPLVAAGQRPRDRRAHRPRDLLVGCATLVVLGLVTAFAPRVWALGAAASPRSGCCCWGCFWPSAPGASLAYLDSDGRTTPGAGTCRRRTTTPRPGRSWLAAVALVVAPAALLRQVPAARPPRRRAGASAPSLRPCWPSARSSLVLELEPPCGPGSSPRHWRPPSPAGLPGGRATTSSPRSSAASPRRTSPCVTLYAASAADLLTRLRRHGAGPRLLVAACALREREGSRPRGRARGRRWRALAGGWALVELGPRPGGRTRRREALALAVYAGLVGVARLPAHPSYSPRGSPWRSPPAVLAARGRGFAVDERTARPWLLTVVGTAIALIAVTTRDRSLLGWLGAVVLGSPP